MPGYATWQQLYQEEYFQMKEEGFDLTGLPAPENLLEQLPLPEKLQNTAPIAENEKEYERAYHHLWARHAKGVAPDFPYKEPETLTDILSQAAALPELGPTVSWETASALPEPLGGAARQWFWASPWKWAWIVKALNSTCAVLMLIR